jgi:hypothetical protein
LGKALLLMAAPLLCGSAWFLANAPSQREGVYVETAAGAYKLNGHGVDVVRGCDLPTEGGVPLSDALLTAPVVPGEQPTAFYVIARSDDVAASDDCAQLYFFAANNGSAARVATALPLRTHARDVRPQVSRVTSDNLQLVELRKRYLQVITRQPGSRTTFEGFAALVVRRGSAPPRMYPVRVGPRGRE